MKLLHCQQALAWLPPLLPQPCQLFGLRSRSRKRDRMAARVLVTRSLDPEPEGNKTEPPGGPHAGTADDVRRGTRARGVATASLPLQHCWLKLLVATKHSLAATPTSNETSQSPPLTVQAPAPRRWNGSLVEHSTRRRSDALGLVLELDPSDELLLFHEGPSFCQLAAGHSIAFGWMQQLSPAFCRQSMVPCSATCIVRPATLVPQVLGGSCKVESRQGEHSHSDSFGPPRCHSLAGIDRHSLSLQLTALLASLLPQASKLIGFGHQLLDRRHGPSTAEKNDNTAAAPEGGRPSEDSGLENRNGCRQLLWTSSTYNPRLRRGWTTTGALG